MVQPERDIENVQSLTQTPLILDVCSRVTGMRFTAVARVTEDRWITCASLDHLGFGLEPGDELEVDSTICNEVRACSHVIAIDDVEVENAWRDHPTPRRYGFRSYISMPIIRRDGSFFGTLCALDPEPRAVRTPETLGMFSLFAQLIAAELDTRDEVAVSKRQLMGERETARLREEFIAVVGHDLRNPLAALSAGLRLLERPAHEAPPESVLAAMKQAVFRMNAIIENLLDLARGRLGEGLTAEMQEGVDVARVIEGVAEELRAVAEQPIELRLDLDWPVRCDPQRIGQLVSNLLGNAVRHGAAGAPILLEARSDGSRFSVSVANEGEPIAEEAMPSLFQPFARGGDRPSQQGLGLGLYIGSEIAKAHGGELSARSTPERTTFQFTMPQG